jgi:hypothetical protein
LKDVEQNNDNYDLELNMDFVSKVKNDELLFIKRGKGKKILTLNIFVKNMSYKYPVIGLE